MRSSFLGFLLIGSLAALRAGAQTSGTTPSGVQYSTGVDMSAFQKGGTAPATSAAAAAPATDPNSVNKLSTYAWAAVQKPLETRIAALEKDGWKRVYSEYNLVSQEQAIVHSLSYEPGTSYTALGYLKEGGDSTAFFRVVDADNGDAPSFLYDDIYMPGTPMIASDFQTGRSIKKLLFASVAGGTPTDGALLVFSRPADNRRDFDAIMAAAPTGFESLKARPAADPEGTPIHMAALGLGSNSKMIYADPDGGKAVYWIGFTLDAPNASKALMDVLAIINERAKAGTYKAVEGAQGDWAITEINNAAGERIFRLMSSGKLNKMRMLFYQ